SGGGRRGGGRRPPRGAPAAPAGSTPPPRWRRCSNACGRSASRSGRRRSPASATPTARGSSSPCSRSGPTSPSAAAPMLLSHSLWRPSGAAGPAMAKSGHRRAKVLLERRGVRLLLLGLGPILLLAGGAYYYVTGGRYVSTDDAYVQADKVHVSSDVAGRVIEVEVGDHQTVAKGALLFRIDDEPYRIALARAEALLVNARNNIEAMKATYRQKQAQLQQAKDSLDFYKRELDRQQKLVS